MVMKELTIEEKAKRYDKAIERAKAYQGLMSEMEIIFPELKESEDEKIKKQIIYAIKELHVCDETKRKCIAWLEKQGEQKPVEENKGNNGGISPNSEWSEKDKRYLDNAITLLTRPNLACVEANDELRIKIVEWLKTYRILKSWKPTERQLSALDYHVKATCQTSWQYKETKELLEQLKKL